MSLRRREGMKDLFKQISGAAFEGAYQEFSKRMMTDMVRDGLAIGSVSMDASGNITIKRIPITDVIENK